MNYSIKKYIFLATIIGLMWNGTTSAQGVEVLDDGRITNVADPTADQDAIPKAYADELLKKLALSFGTKGIQHLLDRGYDPLALVEEGVPVDSLYGRMYEGGLIFYLDVMDTIPGIEGLVAASMDAPTMFRWGYNGGKEGCNFFTTNATLTGIGDGATNTMTVLNAACDSEGSAFEYVDNLTLNGYTDWYLPANDELVLVFQNLASKNIGDFNGSVYWSSTESEDDTSWFYSVAREIIDSVNKSTEFSVRAIRLF